MLDGIEENDCYSADFFVDLQFEEFEIEEEDQEEKKLRNQTWTNIVANCEKKRKQTNVSISDLEVKKEEEIKNEEKPIFVIDSPTMEGQEATNMREELKANEFKLDDDKPEVKIPAKTDRKSVV